jgi:hypothetical protein
MNRRIILAVGLLLSLTTGANAYTKPQMVPTFNVVDHGVTIAIWAEQSIVGQFIGVFELQGTSWNLCNQCYTNPEYPLMDPAVVAAGGPDAYVASKVGSLNSILAARYPAIGGAQTMLQKVTSAVGAYGIKYVNGVPQLYKP